MIWYVIAAVCWVLYFHFRIAAVERQAQDLALLQAQVDRLQQMVAEKWWLTAPETQALAQDLRAALDGAYADPARSSEPLQ